MGTLGPAEGIAYCLAMLQADATLTALLPNGANSIYRKVAPQAAINNPPFILINYQGGADVMGAFATRIMAPGLYQAAAYGPDTMYSTLVSVARLLDADLHRKSGTAEGSAIIASYREQPLELSDVVTVPDQVWTRVGGLYRCLVV